MSSTTPDTPAYLAAALAEVSSALAGHPADSLERVCEISAEALAVERVGVWLLCDGGRMLRCLSLFDTSSRQHCHGCTLCTADFPRYIAALTASPVVPVADIPNDPRTAELANAYLKPLGVTALLDAPVPGARGVVGVLCHETTAGPREWTLAERRFTQELALLLTEPLIIAAARLAPPTPDRTLVDRLAAGVAHDFKNILTVVMGYSEVVARRATLAPEDREALRQVGLAAERGNALADDLLLIATDRPRRTQVLSPSKVIKESLPLLRSLVGDRHEIVFEGCPQGGRVFLDPSSLNRVVTNLVVNARDASPDGGTIVVRVRDDGHPAGGDPSKPYQCVEVADRGTGIDPTIRGRLFDPFVSTKATGRGTGLGLAVVKQIVDRAGGQVRVEDRPGGGTSFQVYLPRIAADTTAG
jgi:two-component system cell cycle sensor histidine kinase/response regulator CckA